MAGPFGNNYAGEVFENNDLTNKAEDDVSELGDLGFPAHILDSDFGLLLSDIPLPSPSPSVSELPNDHHHHLASGELSLYPDDPNPERPRRHSDAAGGRPPTVTEQGRLLHRSNSGRGSPYSRPERPLAEMGSTLHLPNQYLDYGGGSALDVTGLKPTLEGAKIVKQTVGSQAHEMVSRARRKSNAKYFCPVEGCGKGFTTNQNLECE